MMNEERLQLDSIQVPQNKQAGPAARELSEPTRPMLPRLEGANEHVARLLPELEHIDFWLQQKLYQQQEQASDDEHNMQSLLLSPEELEAGLPLTRGAPLWADPTQASATAVSWAGIDIECSSAADSRLAALVERFGLSSFERRVLLLCLLARFDSRYSLIFSFMQKNENKRWPSADLLLGLFCDGALERAAQRKCLLPQAPLLRHGLLVTVDRNGKSVKFSDEAGLQLERGVFHYLIGDELLPELLERCGKWLVPPAYADICASFTQAVAQVCFEPGDESSTPILFLRGSMDSGRAAVVARAAAGAQRRAFCIDLEHLPAEEEVAWDTLGSALREARLKGGCLVVRSLAAFAERYPQLITSLASWFAEHRGPIVCLGEPDTPLLWLEGRAQLVMEMPERSMADEVTLIKKYAATMPVESELELERLIQRFRVSPDTLGRVFEEADLYRRQRAPDGLLSHADLASALRLRAQQNFGKLAQRLEPRRGFDDLVLNDSLQVQMQEILAAIRHREATLKSGFERKIGYGTGISALFYGDSGTGKSMAAEALAGALGVDLIKIDLSTVVNKYIGETEKNLSRIFDLATADAGVLFFDEADALFGKRSEVKDAKDRYANIEVSYLLQRLERYPGLVVLASNNRSHLDSAFCRRLTFMLHFTFPEADVRERMWREIWPQQLGLSDRIDFADLAQRVEVTGGTIRNAALLASWLAASEGQQIELVHIKRALRRELAKTGQITSGL